MAALREGLDRALFLAFREGCSFLEKWEVEELAADPSTADLTPVYRCKNPENRFRKENPKHYQGIYKNDLPNCSIFDCPIYKELEQKEGPVQQFEAFMSRLGSE